MNSINAEQSQFHYPVLTQSILNYMVENDFKKSNELIEVQKKEEFLNNEKQVQDEGRLQIEKLKEEFQLQSVELNEQFLLLNKLEQKQLGQQPLFEKEEFKNQVQDEERLQKEQLKADFSLQSVQLNEQYLLFNELEQKKLQQPLLHEIIEENIYKEQEDKQQTLARVCTLSFSNTSKTPAYFIIASYIQGFIDYQQYCLLYYGKLYFCEKSKYILTDKNEVFIYTQSSSLMKFVCTSNNQMQCQKEMAFKGFMKKQKYTRLFYLKNEKLGKHLVALYVDNMCLFVNCLDNEIVGSVTFQQPRSQAIVWTDDKNLYFCAGRESPETCEYIELNQILDGDFAIDIKSQQLEIKYKSWSITKSSMHNAIVLKSNNKLYIVGRKKEKLLVIENLNLFEKKIEIDYAQTKVDQKFCLNEGNIAKLDDGSFFYLEDNVKAISEIQAKFINI